MCSTAHWQPCTSLLSARSEPPRRAVPWCESPTHHTLWGENRDHAPGRVRGCPRGRKGTIQPHTWPKVFGDWSVLSAAVPSVGHGCPSTYTPAEEKRAPVAPQELGWECWGDGTRDQSPQSQTDANFTSLKSLLKGAPCWQGAPEAPGSCWAVSQVPVLGSNTFVAGQILCCV